MVRFMFVEIVFQNLKAVMRSGKTNSKMIGPYVMTRDLVSEYKF